MLGLLEGGTFEPRNGQLLLPKLGAVPGLITGIPHCMLESRQPRGLSPSRKPVSDPGLCWSHSLQPLCRALCKQLMRYIVMGSVVGSLLDPVGSQHSLSLPSLQARAADSAGVRLPPAGWTDNFHSSHLPPQRQAWKELLECMGGSCLEGSERLWVSLVTVGEAFGPQRCRSWWG